MTTNRVEFRTCSAALNDWVEGMFRTNFLAMCIAGLIVWPRANVKRVSVEAVS